MELEPSVPSNSSIHKSIKSLKVKSKNNSENLAKFSIITGGNGAGKSHLAEAFAEGKLLAYKSNNGKKIKYMPKIYTYTDFRISSVNEVSKNVQYHATFKFTILFSRNFLSVFHNQMSLGQRKIFIENFDEIKKIAIDYYEHQLQIEKSNVHGLHDTQEITDGYFKNIDIPFSSLRRIILELLPFNRLERRHLDDFKKIDIQEEIKKFDDYLQRENEALYLTIKDLEYEHAILFSYEDMDVLKKFFSEKLPQLLKKFYLEHEGKGESPLDEFNKVLTDIGLGKYQLTFLTEVKEPQLGIQFEIPTIMLKSEGYCIDVTAPPGSSQRHSLDTLSGGEKTLLAMASVFYAIDKDNAGDYKPNLIIFDEVESSLHPKMIKIFIEEIVHKLLLAKDVNVMMITHSPTTIALAQKGEKEQKTGFYVLEDEKRDGHKILNEVAAQEAIEDLLCGVSELRITSLERKVIYCEAQKDVERFTRIYGALTKVYRPLSNSHFKLYFRTLDLTDKLKKDINNILKQDIDASEMKKKLKPLVNEGTGKHKVISYIKKENKNNPQDKIYGLIDYDFDKDTYNKKTEEVLTLGGENRHSIENYIFDPLILLFTKELCSNNKQSIHSFYEKENLQEKLDEVTEKLCEAYKKRENFDEEKLEPMPANYGSAKYDESIELQIPKFILEINGHDYENIVKESNIISLNGGKDLAEHIIERIFENEIIDKIIPSDFYQTFEQLCNK